MVSGLTGDDEIACLERELTQMAAAIIQLPAHDVGRTTSFTDLGIDSLMAVELKNRIQHDTGVDVPLVRLLEGPSIADLALLVAAHIRVMSLRGDVANTGDLKEIEI